MTLPPPSADHTLNIYLSLAQYPILGTHIRERMRREMFERGVISSHTFEAEVREKAVHSQGLEGLYDPFAEEPADLWELRLMRVRDHLTDFYFAYNLPYDLFEQIVRDILSEQGAREQELLVSFNPELAPQSMLFEQASAIEKMLPERRAQAEARLREIKVVLIRTLISDQLAYVSIAKNWFTVTDLNEIRKRKFGQGKIGGKAAGMLLAARILDEVGDDELRSCLKTPESYFIGADLTYDFMIFNGLMHWADQKYKPEKQIRSEYPKLQRDFLGGALPPDIIDSVRELLVKYEKKPLVVRSSSLLEDNFGTSFAGKYESHFCPNQGTLEENLKDLSRAVIRIYASIFNPDALLYRRAKGLQDYDERMAILIQVVEGDKYAKFFLPHAAGVAFSQNIYRWSPKIRRNDGFVRLVWGLGTRAVDRIGTDYTRLVALSHPTLHPEKNTKELVHYSQKYVDLIDLEENKFKTLPVNDVLTRDYPALRYIAQIERDGYVTPIRSRLVEEDTSECVLTFDELFNQTQLDELLVRMLTTLEKYYGNPVDTEFAIQINNHTEDMPNVEIALLQCRPQSKMADSVIHMPDNIPDEDIIFSTRQMAPKGQVSDIQYVVFVTPEGYFSLPTQAARAELSNAISNLNSAMEGERFICLGPGRWGTTNPDIGVRIGYGDIYNTLALVEVTGERIGSAPEASFGTHFFQDLVEANIYPLAVDIDDEDTIFNRQFFYDTPNMLHMFMPDGDKFSDCLRVIQVESFCSRHYLELVMDDVKTRSVAFLKAY